MRAILGLIALAMPAGVAAQALQCAAPAAIQPPRPDGPTASQPRRVLPTASYTLALGWSPQYCRSRLRDERDAFQCGGGRPKFGFTLHGLWPDGRSKDWPQYCRSAALLPTATIRRNLCATPSAQLLQHEWAKHGTCMTTDPDAYFGRATRLYRGVGYPDMDALSRRPLTAGRFAQAFALANRGMRPDMLRVTADGRWLEEVWLCLDLRFRPTRCPAGGGGLAARTPIKIWRGGR